MATITIPKKLAGKGDLVVLPREEYEALVRHAAKKEKTVVKKLPAGLRQALREVKEGKVTGPFNTVEELMKDLES